MARAREPEQRRARIRLAALLIGILLVLPSVTAGFFGDDYLQIAQLEKWSPSSANPLDLYAFVPRSRARAARLHDLGLLPYFAAERLQIAFVRPLSSALMWADHAVFGRSPVGYHVHTLVWYVVFLVAGCALLTRTLPSSLATPAAVIFCLCAAHAMPATWVAARTSIVTTALALLAWLAHRRWRVDGWRPGMVLAPLLSALALAAGEMAVGALGYLVAWELGGRRSRRGRAMAPTLILVAGYLVAYRLTGSGVRASGAYLDPFGDPLGFLRAAPARLALLTGGLVLAAPIDLAGLDPRAWTPLVFLGAAGAIGVCAWLWGALRRMPADEAAAVRFFALGAAGSVLVAAPALPGARTLTAASLGGAVIVGALLRDAWRAWRARHRSALAALALAVFGIPNVLLAPLALGGNVLLLKNLFEDNRRLAREAEIAAPVPARVVILALADPLSLSFQILRAFELGLTPAQLQAIGAAHERGGAGLPLPDRLGYRGATVLSFSPARTWLRRTGASSLELSTSAGTLLDGFWTATLRAPDLPLSRGTTIRFADITAQVLEDRAGRPTRVAFLFDQPLDDPGLIFLAPVDGGLHRFALPAAGQEVELPNARR